MFAELLVDIIFRLLNFAALMALFAFIFKKYFRNDIEASIEHDRLEETNLNTRIGEMQHRGVELSAEIIKQEKLCEYLKARTSQWKNAFATDVEQRRHEQKELHKKSSERALQQAEAIERERRVQTILPKALEIARNKLIKSCESPAYGKHFVQDILSHMKKSL